MMTSEEFAQTFRRITKECAASLTAERGHDIDRLEIRAVGEQVVEAWSPDGQDYLTEYWLDETRYRTTGDLAWTISPEANGIWRASW